MNIDLIRDLAERSKTFGKLFVDGKYLGETLEDTDRFLEDGGEKIDGQTAIPRGRCGDESANVQQCNNRRIGNEHHI